MKVAIYTPVYNEADHAERWAQTTEEADHRLWVDFDSDDDTVAEARSQGIKVLLASLRPFRFDQARNIALALVPDDIDIVLQLDADETLEPGWRQQLDILPAHERRWSYDLRDESGVGWISVQRSNCHRRHGFRWVHPIHEVIAGPEPDRHIPITVVHRPDTSKPRTSYLPMLQQAVSEEPDNARMVYYLGRELFYANRWAEAREVLWRYVRMPNGWAPERGDGYLMLAEMDHDPERWLWHAIAQAPRRREPWVRLAQHYHRIGRGMEARMYINQAELRTDQTIYVSRAWAWGHNFTRIKTEIMEA